MINILPGMEYPLNSKKQIEFCWLAQKNSVTLPLQKKMEAYLKEQFQEKVQLDVFFTGLCLDNTNPMGPIGLGFYDAPDNPPGLQAEINNVTANSEYPGHPTTYSRGVWAFRNLTDIVLTSAFHEVAPSLVEQVSGLNSIGREALLLSIALHESLHALGIAHEHDRADSTCVLSPKMILDPKLYTFVGPYDEDSIMNYCKTHSFDFENAGPIPLSEGDVQTVRSLYAH
ncbi:hypothetical protein K2X05_08850 [bacterium]|nr:hypothetical protein [bacterium]